MKFDNLVTKDYRAAQFAQQNMSISEQVSELKASAKILYWMVGLVVVVEVVPFLESFMGN